MSEKLVIEGGKPTIQEKLPSWPWFTEEIIQAAQPRQEIKEEEIKVEPVNIYKAEIEDFSGSILEDKALSFPPQLGLRNLKIALTAYESAKKGKPLRL